MNDGYILVFYDFSMVSKTNIKMYNKFRKALIKLGYSMLQKSVYYKYIVNNKMAISEENKVEAIERKDSSLMILHLTRNQFNEIKQLSRNKTSFTINSEYVEY